MSLRQKTEVMGLFRFDFLTLWVFTRKDLNNLKQIYWKKNFLAEIPELESYKDGRDVYLIFKKDVGSVMSEASTDSDAIILTNSAKILRRHMLDHKCKQSNLHETSVYNPLPPSLL